MVSASILNLKEPLCHLSHLLASGCSACWNLNFLKFNKKFKHSKEIACNGKDYSSSANSNLLWMYLKHFWEFWITKYLILLGSSYLMFTINSIIHFSYFFFLKIQAREQYIHESSFCHSTLDYVSWIQFVLSNIANHLLVANVCPLKMNYQKIQKNLQYMSPTLSIWYLFIILTPL